MQINILHLYPDLLNLYGDKGNIAALSKRLLWRGINAEVFEVEGELSLENCDILYLGGGGEREEAEVFEKLFPYKEAIKEYAEKGGVLLATCGGFELLGRLIGNVVLECEYEGESFDVVGFENHLERVNIKNYTPLAKVVSGFGNDEKGKCEGIIYKNIFATHLHGPLLPKNPTLCDIIIKKALENKGEKADILKPLDDNFEQIAQNEVKKRVLLK